MKTEKIAIKNTAELRNFLLNQMVGVVDGSVTHDQARSVCNLAQQVHNTLSTEIKLLRAASDIGADVTLAPITFSK